MMRSLSSAVAGLRTHQTKMDVIGNNIANVNTYGFKASRTTFADVYYQNLSSGSGPSTATGGTNPTQIGYGSAVATIDILNTQSGAASTDRAMDVYITGDGFLVTQDASGNPMFTRLGNMGFDAEGNLIDSSGNYVMGLPADKEPNEDGSVDPTSMSQIKVKPEDLDRLTGISISASGEIVGVLPGGAKITLGASLPNFIVKNSEMITEGSNLQGPVRLNVGGLPTVAQLNDPDFTMLTLGNGILLQAKGVSFGDVAMDADDAVFEVTANGQLKMTYKLGDVETSALGTLGTDGKIVMKNGSDIVMTIETNHTGTGSLKTNSTSETIAMGNFYQMTTKNKGGGVETTGVIAEADLPANKRIELKGASILVNDLNTAFSNTIAQIGTSEGSKLSLGRIVLAKFPNAAGLSQAGGSKYVTTPNSGEPTYVMPGLEGTGSLKANYLEMSNVDISKEFTDMITTQRGFQANTRIVTVSDEMLQELVNLKR